MKRRMRSVSTVPSLEPDLLSVRPPRFYEDFHTFVESVHALNFYLKPIGRIPSAGIELCDLIRFECRYLIFRHGTRLYALQDAQALVFQAGCD